MSDTPQQPGLNSLSKSFEPAAIEAQWGPLWEQRGYARAGYRGTGEPKDGEPAFAIQLPPPNVTGTLHMGHAFNQTIMDSLTRYHRMRGFNTLWVPGTDHAGIATQIVVERQLQEQGQSRHDLGRKNFVAKVWEWKEKSGNTITTPDAPHGRQRGLVARVLHDGREPVAGGHETFVQLYEQGLIYRGKRLVNWDPELKTAVSDLEVESEEEDGFLWHIGYPLADGSGALTVATTRPGNHAGRRRRDGPSRGRALQAPGGPEGEAAAVRPRHPDHRRRVRGQGIRHRRGEGHARARPQRLRRGPAPRAADDRRADARREDQRQRARRNTAAWTASSRASRSWPTWRRRACWWRPRSTS